MFKKLTQCSCLLPLRLQSDCDLRKSFHVPKTVYCVNYWVHWQWGVRAYSATFCRFAPNVFTSHTGAHRSFILLGGPKGDVQKSIQAEKKFFPWLSVFAKIGWCTSNGVLRTRNMSKIYQIWDPRPKDVRRIDPLKPSTLNTSYRTNFCRPTSKGVTIRNRETDR